MAIRGFFGGLGEFRVVIEASCSYRWLYELGWCAWTASSTS
jgi:hypothetical protein